MAQPEPRPMRHLRDLHKIFGPDVFKVFEAFRAGEIESDSGWPRWCFLPMNAARSIVDIFIDETGLGAKVGGMSINFFRAVCSYRFAALFAWRTTKGIYRFDPDLLESVAATPIDEIPVEALYRMPEWCMYFDCSPIFDGIDRGSIYSSAPILGFYAFLDHDMATGKGSLCFLLDLDKEDIEGGYLVPLQCVLTPSHRIIDGYRATLVQARETLWGDDPTLARMIENPETATGVLDMIRRMVAVVLYVCADNVDLQDARRKRTKPYRPHPIMEPKGPRLLAVPSETRWEVGYRVGAVLRRVKAAEHEAVAQKTVHGGTKKRPHVRKAHFHRFWTGPREATKERAMVVRWLHPILVGADDIIPTIYPVK